METIRKTGLRKKLVLSILGVGLTSVVLVLLSVYFIGRETLRNSIGTNFKDLAESASDTIDTLIRNHLEEAVLLASSNSIVSAVEESNQFYNGLSDTEIKGRIAEIEQRWVTASGFDAYLLDVQNNRASFYLNSFLGREKDSNLHTLVLVTNAQGALVAANKSPAHYSYGQTLWWQKTFAAGTGQSYLSNIEFNSDLGMKTFSVGTPILKNGKTIGAFYMIHNAQSLFHSLALARAGKAAHTVLVNDSGNILFDPSNQKSDKMLSPELLKELTPGRSGWISSKYDPFFSGRRAISGFAPVRDTWAMGKESFGGNRWIVLTGQDPSETYAPVYTLLGWIAMIGLAGAGVIAAFGWVISRGILRPVMLLREGTEIIGGGNLNYHIDIKTGDEIEDLARHFNDMTLKLKIFYFKLEEEVRARTKELEYQKNELATLYSMVTILNQSREMKEILDSSLSKIVELTEATSGIVWMMDEKTSRYTVKASFQLVLDPQQLESLVQILDSIASKVILEGTSWYSENVTVQEDIAKLAYNDIGFYSVYAIPLTSKNKTLGVLFLLYKNIRALAANEIKMIESVGNQIGVAVEHALLFSKIKNMSRLGTEEK